MFWLALYFGGVLCLILAVTAAFNNGLADPVLTFNKVIIIALLWPLIFGILCFKKF